MARQVLEDSNKKPVAKVYKKNEKKNAVEEMLSTMNENNDFELNGRKVIVLPALTKNKA